MLATFNHDDHVRGYWLPMSGGVLDDWLYDKLATVEQNSRKDYQHRVIQEFRDFIEGDSEICAGFTQMFDEVVDSGAVRVLFFARDKVN